MTLSPFVNAESIARGVWRKICALISSLFLEIHKVFILKSVVIRTKIFSQSVLDDLIIVYLRGRWTKGPDEVEMQKVEDFPFLLI